MKLARDKLDPIAGRYRAANTALARGCISGDFVHSARDWQLRGRSINGFYVNPELNLMFGTVEMNVTLYAPPLIFPYRYFFFFCHLIPLSRVSQEVSPTSSKKNARRSDRKGKSERKKSRERVEKRIGFTNDTR